MLPSNFGISFFLFLSDTYCQVGKFRWVHNFCCFHRLAICYGGGGGGGDCITDKGVQPTWCGVINLVAADLWLSQWCTVEVVT